MMSDRVVGPGRGIDHSLRSEFIGQLEESCRNLGVELVWNCDKWIAQLRFGGHRTQVVGYAFELNSSAAARLSIDKAATSERLAEHGVPTLQHHALTIDLASTFDRLQQMLEPLGYPTVIKPIDGYNGYGVTVARSRQELIRAIESIAVEHPTVVVSPYISARSEYRVIILDDEPLLIYRKVISRNRAEWRFNAEFGSTAQLVGLDEPRRPELSDIARNTIHALGLRVAAVDILESDVGELSVVEVNEDFSSNHFSRQSAYHSDLMTDVYKRIVATSFGRSSGDESTADPGSCQKD